MSHNSNGLLNIAAFGAAGLLAVVGLFLFGTDPTHGPDTIAEVNRSTSYGPEMSQKRIEWEFERLRDPATGQIPPGIRGDEIEFAATHPRRDGRALFKGSGASEHTWVNRGPWNVGGRTRAVAYDITGEDTILAGGVSGGMWRSSDGGMTWKLVTTPDQIPSVTTIAQDRRPGKTHIWYCGTGELYGNSASGGGAFWHGDGIMKSTDNGRTWFSLESTSSGSQHQFNARDNIWRIVTDSTDTEHDVVYAAIYGALLRSGNGGENWSEVLRPSGLFASRAYFTDVAITQEGVVYATFSSDGDLKGIYRSEDGRNYTDITPEEWPESYRRTVIGLAPSNPDAVYFLSETPGLGYLGTNFRGDSSWHTFAKYSYISGDGAGDGGSWDFRTENLPSFDGSNGDLYSQGGYDLHVRVHPADEDVVFIGGTNLYRSTDGFRSNENTDWIGGFRHWKRDSSVIEYYSYPEHHADQHDVIFSRNDPNVMYSASDGGVHKTLDCMRDSVRWISLNSGYLTSQFYTVAVDHGTPGSNLVMGGTQDNGTWKVGELDPRMPWTRTGSSDGAYCAISDGADYLYVSKQQGRIYRVELDGSGDMTGSTRIDPEGADEYRFINPFVLDPNDSRIMYLPINRRIWRNTDVTAIPLDNNAPTPIGWDSLEQSVVRTGEISTVNASTINPANRLWYGTTTGEVYRMDDVLGDDPIAVEVTSPEFPDDAFVSCVNVDPQDGDRAFVVFSNYGVVSIFETTDAGETWQSVSGNLEESPDGSGAGPSVRWMSVLHRGGKSIYLVGTSTGLYATTDLDGDNTIWVKEGADVFGNVPVDMIDVRQSDGYVAAATHGFGVFTTTIGQIGAVTDGESLHGGLRVVSVSPNPMVEETVVELAVPDDVRRGELTLWNAEGRVVRTVPLERTGTGRARAVLVRRDSRGARLPAGAYFFRARAGAHHVSGSVHIR